MKRSAKMLIRVIALALIAVMLLGTAAVFAADNVKYTSAPQIYQLVRDGYNGGTKGPISIVKGTFRSGWTSRSVYLVTLSGTEIVLNQSTEVLTDLFSGFNLNNAYYSNVVNIITQNIPKNANLIIAGHSLGGMVAQQVAANSTIKSRYNILNTVTFGSPLLSAGTREGTVKRLGDVSDVVPILSVHTVFNTIWALGGLNREDGGYYLRPITAHNESYGRSDVWGKYDVVGTKNGGATLTLDLSTRVFYQSPIIDW